MSSSDSLAELEQSQSNANPNVAQKPGALGFAAGNVALRPGATFGGGFGPKFGVSTRPAAAPHLAAASPNNGRAKMHQGRGFRLPGLKMLRDGIDRIKMSQPERDFEKTLKRLATPEELPALHEKIAKLSELMETGFNPEDFALMRELRSRDPRSLSSTLRTNMQEAVQEERYSAAATFKSQLNSLKPYLPEYQLAGTWKGSIITPGQEPKPLESGYVSIMYDGESISAMDAHGKSTFTADISAPTGLEKPPSATDEADDIEKQKEKLQEQFDYAQFLETLTDEEKANLEKARGRLNFVEDTADAVFAEQGECETFNGEGAYNGQFVRGRMYLMDHNKIGFLMFVPGSDGKELAAAGGVEEIGEQEKAKASDGKEVFVVFERLNLPVF